MNQPQRKCFKTSIKRNYKSEILRKTEAGISGLKIYFSGIVISRYKNNNSSFLKSLNMIYPNSRFLGPRWLRSIKYSSNWRKSTYLAQLTVWYIIISRTKVFINWTPRDSYRNFVISERLRYFRNFRSINIYQKKTFIFPQIW